MTDRHKAVICGNFIFPDGNAAGKRVLGLGYIFRDLGYEVVYLGMGPEVIEKQHKTNEKKYDSQNFLSYFYPVKKK